MAQPGKNHADTEPNIDRKQRKTEKMVDHYGPKITIKTGLHMTNNSEPPQYTAYKVILKYRQQ